LQKLPNIFVPEKKNPPPKRYSRDSKNQPGLGRAKNNNSLALLQKLSNNNLNGERERYKII